jgi:hypothetical protein
LTWIRNVTTEYHQQDTNYYCGGAVAQMILDSIGSGLLDQNVLYNSNHSHNTQSNWYTDPDGLNYTLNFYKPNPPTFNNFFVTYAKDTELEGSEKFVYTLWRYSVPTGTLVYGCGHWIVVRGLSTDVEPSPGSTYMINGFWIILGLRLQVRQIQQRRLPLLTVTAICVEAEEVAVSLMSM